MNTGFDIIWEGDLLLSHIGDRVFSGISENQVSPKKDLFGEGASRISIGYVVFYIS
jgi:hypothetical protein